MRVVFAVALMMIGVFLLALSEEDATVAHQSSITPTITPTAAPGREPIQLPLDYRDELVRYATIDRIDGISRDLYISVGALEAIANDETLPERTFVLIEAFESNGRGEDGRLVRTQADPEVHVAEARSTWQIADLAATSRVGNWNFGAFDSRDGAVFTEADLNDCFSCHESASNRDFLFSSSLLEAFVETGEVQYLYCRRTGRSRCS